jgi:DNA polymerase I-like protein with 3'-5' exonuclease and polymerase domains
MIAAYLLNPERTRYGLKDLALEFLGRKSKTYEELIGGKNSGPLLEIPENELA